MSWSSRSEDRLLSLDRELCSLYLVVFFSSTQCKIQIRFLAYHINAQKKRLGLIFRTEFWITISGAQMLTRKPGESKEVLNV